jgi:hypothetical protein
MQTNDDKHKLNDYKLVGYDCPLGCYPAPLTPIILVGENEYKAVYLDDDLTCDLDSIDLRSSHSMISKDDKRFEEFDYCKDRLYAVSESDIRFYEVANQLKFFRDLLLNKEFARDDPFLRISLAEDIEDPYLLIHELGSCKKYLEESHRELLPFFGKEKTRIHEIIQKLLKEQKPIPKNRTFVEIQYFCDLLSDKSFAHDDPVARSSLAEYIEEYDTELLPFSKKEDAKFSESYPDFRFRDKNCEWMRGRIDIPRRGVKTLIWRSNVIAGHFDLGLAQ